MKNTFIYKSTSVMEKVMLLAVMVFLLPQETFAATPPRAQFSSSGSSNVTNFRDLIVKLSEIINQLIPFFISLTVLVFIWGVFKLVLAGDSSESRKEARSTITFGIVSLFVMVSVWGLVKILSSTFFGNSFFIPQLK